jgi:hypothetical protein
MMRKNARGQELGIDGKSVERGVRRKNSRTEEQKNS